MSKNMTRSISKGASKTLLVSLLALVSFASNAYTLNLRVDGSRITYDNAYKIGTTDGQNPILVPSDWQATDALATTNQWQPGLMTTAASKFTLTQSGTSSTDETTPKITLPFKLLGMQYNTGGRTPTTTDDPFLGTNTCGISINDGNEISLYNTAEPSGVAYPVGNCHTSKSIQTDEIIQPFYFTRPVISIDEADLLTAISELDTTFEDTYYGTIPVSAVYYFIENGIATYRQLPANSITVRVSYSSAVLTDIIPDPLTIITPVYDRANHIASGSAPLKIQAIGYFTKGIRMTFQDRPYEMRKISLPDISPTPIDEATTDGSSLPLDRGISADEAKVPYFIKCVSCEVEDIVINGVLQEAAKPHVDYILDSPSADFDFYFQVGYENIEAETIVTGTYQDTFTVMFELIM